MKARNILKIIGGFLLLSLLLGLTCDPKTTEPFIELYTTTAAPPSTVAKITHDDELSIYRIDLSRGVVLGVRCWDYCKDKRDNCESLTLASKDNAILEVRTVYTQSGSNQDYALVGLTTGSTALTISSKCASQTYTVEVLKPSSAGTSN